MKRIDFNVSGYSGNISLKISMPVQRLVLRRLELRAIYVLAALLSLCVSNNVGPCFLPLPVVTDCVAENSQHQNDTASRSSSRTLSDCFRVPMGQTQNRADRHAQAIAGVPKIGFMLLGDTRVNLKFNSLIPLLPAAAISQPPGRAPPRLA